MQVLLISVRKKMKFLTHEKYWERYLLVEYGNVRGSIRGKVEPVVASNFLLICNAILRSAEKCLLGLKYRRY